VVRGNAHAVVHLRTIDQFLKLVYLHVNNSQYTFYKKCDMLTYHIIAENAEEDLLSF
jgi:hypothetical protein